MGTSRYGRVGRSITVMLLVSVSACGDDGVAGCLDLRDELSALEEELGDEATERWEDIAELQAAIRRRQALLAAIADGAC